MMPTFAHPWLLILLPVVLWLGLRLRTGAPAAFRRPPLGLRHPILARLNLARTPSTNTPSLWLALVAALLILAAAQPQTQGGWLPPAVEGRDILLLIDTSPSMAIQDMTLNNQSVPRMDVLKHAAQGFINARAHDRIGMIVFSDHAATLMPLTLDHTALQAQLARLNSGNTGTATALGEGLGVALRQIQAHPQHPPVVVIFSDGDNTGGILRPREALAYAEPLGLHLYSVAVTSDPAVPALQTDGLREPSLTEMSELTGGRAYQASDANSLQNILTDIDQREASHSPPPTERAAIDWYALPLSLALLILALGQWAELRGRARP